MLSVSQFHMTRFKLHHSTALHPQAWPLHSRRSSFGGGGRSSYGGSRSYGNDNRGSSRSSYGGARGGSSSRGGYDGGRSSSWGGPSRSRGCGPLCHLTAGQMSSTTLLEWRCLLLQALD